MGLAAAAFFAGRRVGTARATGGERLVAAAAAADPTAVDPTAPAARGAPSRAVDLLQLRRAVEQAQQGQAVDEFPLDETPEARAARRAETDAQITQTLGQISAEQRELLLDFNDRAIEFQRRQTGEFQRGTLTHEQYMTQLHEEVLGQLEELHAIVTDDQYRVLTGLEPGVDPYDFMVTGQGGAPGAPGAHDDGHDHR
ncbi:MAG: hypothetical protein IPL61_29855 [Myxococcales bacterium]|nr:hypothetical protein [Myxococcales bacterium]